MTDDLAGAVGMLAAAAVLTVVTPTVATAQDVRILTVEQTAIQALQAPPAAVPAANPLGVVAWVDRQDNTYASGERVRLFVQTNKDAYVTVLNVGPDGSTTVLFPNRFQADGLVRANTVTEVPDPAAQARITVTGTTGAELIKVIASTRPATLFDAAQLAAAGAFQAVRSRADRTARDLSVVMAEETGAEWDVYDAVIWTVPALPESASAVAAPGATWPTQAFALEVAADKAFYRAAEPVTLLVKAGADCHLTLLNTGPGGASRLLFPNRYQQQTLIRAGQTVVVPGIGDRVSIVPLGPAGVEHVTAVCRTGAAPALGAPDGFGSGAFLTLEDAGAAARNLAVVAAQPDQRTAVASASFVVVP